MNRTKIIATLAAGAAGLAAAVALALPATASAYTPDQLPGLGYSVTVTFLGDNCHDWAATGYGHTADLGSDCDPGFQAALDAFVDATYPKPPTTTETTATAPADTTATTATTATTTAPAATTATVTAPAPTETAPAATTPDSAPAATTDTTATQLADLETRIAQLEQQIAALTARVDRIALAGDASWLAFQQALEAGSDPAAAAAIARGTYLNAEYGLGQFATA